MEPSQKSPEIEKFLQDAYGRTDAIRNDRCINPPIGCGKPVLAFRNAISKREYLISGLCQECQDKIFNNPEIFPNGQEDENV